MRATLILLPESHHKYLQDIKDEHRISKAGYIRNLLKKDMESHEKEGLSEKEDGES